MRGWREAECLRECFHCLWANCNPAHRIIKTFIPVRVAAERSFAGRVELRASGPQSSANIETEIICFRLNESALFRKS